MTSRVIAKTNMKSAAANAAARNISVLSIVDAYKFPRKSLNPLDHKAEQPPE
jgi:hypothetical protein